MNKLQRNFRVNFKDNAAVTMIPSQLQAFTNGKKLRRSDEALPEVATKVDATVDSRISMNTFAHSMPSFANRAIHIALDMVILATVGNLSHSATLKEKKVKKRKFWPLLPFQLRKPNKTHFNFRSADNFKANSKGMKGKMFKKLKSIPPVVGYLKQDRVLQIKSLNGYVESFTNTSNFNLKSLIVSRENEPKKGDEDKENIGPGPPLLKSRHQETSSEIDISSFRRPDMNSDSLFDPNLLAAFQQAVKEHVKIAESRIENIKEEEEEPPWKVLEVFEEKCPPGGTDSVILYTTTLRGIRKTFEDCNKIRFLLESFKVAYVERDTSMHMKFREELWKILDGKTLPPRLFVKGRYIGGAEEVLTLHEQGKLKPLFAEIPLKNSCEGCDGVRFLICFTCNGSQKIVAEKQSNQCPDCNENGLIICPHCCCC
ncbi:putative thioredoxin-like protein [Senna tora]|uniref:Putative thioredoxin-like protein n=1 Tax=Senna tora TaxID=362788 RepID=A0A834TI18_9FABA|nr:putative thioredoxin-like protein [Senna tora]